jgi:apolipoprotein N-acyltransferase
MGNNLSHLELLLVVLSHLPLSRGTSFVFGFCIDFVLRCAFDCWIVVLSPPFASSSGLAVFYLIILSCCPFLCGPSFACSR